MIKLENPEKVTWQEVLKRPTQTYEQIEDTVLDVFNAIRNEGDAAVARYTEKFDGLIPENILVSASEIEQAVAQLPEDLKAAITLAKSNITAFHEAQRTVPVCVETAPGVTCWQEKRPIQKVGLYIPGGTAPLFSTILMLAIPAKIAGCKEVVLCTPPDKQGNINPAILFTAQLCGIDKIYKVGGIQAIGSMTFGTETISKVYKIFGPGNQFVTVAKQMATKYNVSIDMPAGPSELLVVADDSADAAFVASDLLSQAEHGADSQVILVSTSKALIAAVEKEIKSQLEVLPRKAIAEKAIANSKLIYVGSHETALELIDEYGPEHFIVATNDNDYYVDNIANAGSVFIGNYTPESAGDYASGTNHTLPTNGYAKQYSGVNLDSFMKNMTFQELSPEGIQNIGMAIELMAAAEGLQAHKNAVTLRLNKLAKQN
ncbi:MULTISPECIES: histidinol dehydrogenase [unclassified Leeuwenhoekiella]|uniref:histidinol dehydrogenase n=1 Tax=unclassified Leeuwenhoekiella TaxID=2615029 RepID=UPI000C4FD515|nr:MULTISPECIES: histidinol dehydrogenase [unclassified Leeuwenhoekiella]MAW95344.1 histidinol dehydrogenase [Leeuwenhoekiella sp.]MBA81732.1 histidinol dehydrogenase [Leeuwenhoekiella sp.]|tara:strand:+ start:1433 stop:2725 length:1293 start_codon:yes stop_codon:yes gene_type:complete